MRVQSFAPIADRHAEILILGSMPGQASLAVRQYYAHPRNAFWPIMAALFDIAPDAPYQARVKALKSSHIAVWDVIASCARSGSLDAGIDDDSLIANDFAGFFRSHAGIARVYFNGSKAESCYRRHVLQAPGIVSRRYLRLPSTSPAHASRSFAAKLAAWRVIAEDD